MDNYDPSKYGATFDRMANAQVDPRIQDTLGGLMGRDVDQGIQNTLRGEMNRTLDSGIEGQLRDQMGGQGEAADWLRSFRNPGVDPAFTSYAQNLGQQWNEQLLPGMRGDAMAGGALGNSRAQIGQALASQRMGQGLSDFANQAYSGQQNRSLQAANQFGNMQRGAAGQLGGMQNQLSQSRQGAAGQLGGLYDNNASIQQSAAGGLGALQNNMYGINAQGAQLGSANDWYGLQQYNSLIGAPVMTSSSKSSSGGGIGGALGTVAGIGSSFIPGGQLAGLGSMAYNSLGNMFSGGLRGFDTGMNYGMAPQPSVPFM